MLIKCKRNKGSWKLLGEILDRFGRNILRCRKGGDPQAANLGQ